MAATISIPPGFPDASTSGVPDGTVLTAYTGPTTITKAGTIIEGKIIDGGLVINAPNVIIKNCIIKNGYYFGVDGEHGGSTLVVQNCDIVGPGTSGQGNSGILGTGQFIGNDISAYENGIMTTGGSGGVISGNYIHDITSSKPDAHFTGIQVEGGESNLRIENNTVMNEKDSNIFLQALYGPISNVVINNNYVGGSSNGNNSYNIYVESRFGYAVTDVAVTNNYINKGYYGYFSIVNSSPKMSGNVLFDTDHGVLPPTGGSSAPPTNPVPPTSPVPPSAPVIASFSKDSGAVGDGITNTNTLQLKGTAAANSTVTIYDGSNQIGSTTANASGSWDYITSVLNDAKHVLTAKSTNSSGQTSTASTAMAVTVDTAAPIAPVLGSNSIVNTNQIKLSGTAEANSKITVYDGTNAVGTTTTDSSGGWSVTTSTLSNGAHALTAKATDVAGNTGAPSQVLNSSIGTSAPPASSGAPKIVSFSQDSGIAGDNITSDNTLSLSGTAAANSTVKVFDGSKEVGSTTANSSGAWSLTTTSLQDGSHALTATATTSSSSGPTPALFEDFNPWSGNVSPDGIWRIAGTWTGTGGDILQPSNVKFTDTYAGETNTGFMSLTTPAGSPLRGAELQSMTTPGYSYGYYEVRMKTANVPDGGVASFFWIEQPNYGSHEWDVEFTLSDSWAGTTNPGRVAFHTHPLENGQWTNLDFNPSQAFHTYGFLWTPGRIDFTVDGEVVRTVTDPALKTDATGYIMMNTWSSGNPDFGGGPPKQDATSVYDWVKFYPNLTSIPAEQGGVTNKSTSSTSNPLSVTIDTKAPTSPGMTLKSVVNANQVQLSGTAEANSQITIYDGTAIVGTGTTSSTGAWSITTKSLSTGTHTLTAKAADAAGNVSAPSQAISTAIGTSTPAPDTVPPSAPVVSGNTIVNTNHVQLSGTAEANSVVTIYEGNAAVGTGITNSTGTWSITTNALSAGTHSLTAKAADAAGNISILSKPVSSVIGETSPGTPPPSVGKLIEAAGATSLVEKGDKFYLNDSNGMGPSLKYRGAEFVDKTDGTWTPIGAEKTATGYQVVWKETSTGLFTVWNTDNNGNYVSHVSNLTGSASGGAIAGTNAGLKSLEATFHQDLNGDGVIGQIAKVIESVGSASLTQVGNNYQLDGASGASNPFLKMGGKIIDANEMGGWTAIGVEQTSTGYQVAWKLAGKDQFSVWNTDSNGNYVSKAIDTASGSSSAIKSLEAGFKQDLNGDGSITGASSNAPVASVGLSNLSKGWNDVVTLKGVADANSQIKLYDGNTSLGTVTTAADGTWSYKTSSGVSDSVHYYTAQQVNGSGQVVGTSGSAILGSTGSNVLKSTSGNDVMIGGGQADTFVFAANFGRDVIKDFATSGKAQDTIQFSKTTFDSFASVLSHASQVDQDVVISHGSDTLTLKNTKLSSLNNGDFHFA